MLKPECPYCNESEKTRLINRMFPVSPKDQKGWEVYCFYKCIICDKKFVVKCKIEPYKVVKSEDYTP